MNGDSHITKDGVTGMGLLSSLFKKSKSGSDPAKPSSGNEAAPAKKEVQQTQQRMPTQTTIDQSARYSSGKKRAPKKEEVEEEVPETRRTTGTGRTASAARAAKNEDVEEEAPKRRTPVPRKEAAKPMTPEERRQSKLTETRKAQIKRDQQDVAVGKRPLELIELDHRLKDFAIHSRLAYNPGVLSKIFTEYLAQVFRDMGYKMVLIRDHDTGLITMLDRPKDENDREVKDKFVVRCIYLKEGSIEPETIISVQEDGALYRADETWCITSTDFTDAAKRRSRKEGAKVKLIDGRRLFKDFLSRYW